MMTVIPKFTKINSLEVKNKQEMELRMLGLKKTVLRVLIMIFFFSVIL